MTIEPMVLTSPPELYGEDRDAASTSVTLSPAAPQSDDIVALVGEIEEEFPRTLRRRMASRGDCGDVPVTCIDRGSGCGVNSQSLIDAFVRVVRRLTPLSAMAFCNEKFPGCFSPLAATIQSKGRGEPFAYRAMLCGSFLDQLVPDATVDLVTSNAALHWLDLNRLPPRGETPRMTRGGIDRELARIASTQWQRLLDSVATELRPGGKLVASFLARSDGHERHLPLALLDRAIKEVVGDAFERSDTLLACPIPIYPRSRAEIVAPFQRPSKSPPLVLDRCRVEAIECPYYRQFLRSGDAAGYANSFTEFIRAFSSTRLTEWLANWFSADDCHRVANAIYDSIRDRIGREPASYRMRKHRAIIVATKT
jgi:hypothetical protein